MNKNINCIIKSFTSFILIFLHLNSYCQRVVNVDDLIKRKYNNKDYKYYIANDTLPFSGKATSFYFGNKIEMEMVIEKGICTHLNNFSESGQLILSFNYLPDGIIKDGKYLKCSDRGDTLQFGYYIRGVKNGRWIETEDEITTQTYYEKGIRKEIELP